MMHEIAVRINTRNLFILSIINMGLCIIRKNERHGYKSHAFHAKHTPYAPIVF